MVDLNRLISSAMKSGKVFLGTKQALAASKTGRAIALIVASNCQAETLSDLQRSSIVSKIPLFVYPASSSDLGIACGKPFAVSALTIREVSDSAVLRMVKESVEVSEGQVNGSQLTSNHVLV